MNKQIDLNDVVHAILRGMMDQHPSEITIGDFKLLLHRFGCRKETSCPYVPAGYP